MKEGFLIGGGLIVAGVLLQWAVGPVVWDAFRWPVNGIVLAVFLGIITFIFLTRKKIYGFQFLGTYKAAVPALVYAVLLTIIMGLSPQMSSDAAGGMWLNHILSFWPFVLIYVYLALILGQTVLRQVSGCKFQVSEFKSSRVQGFKGSLLSHLGLFLAMTMATLGNADMQRLKMITVKGETEWRALTAQQQVVELPIAISLKEFIMETYADGSPKRFASEVQILTKSGKNIQATIDVNKPVSVEGWKIYQYGYDTQLGPLSQTSILELVRDPWLPYVYVGIYLLLAGAVLMMLRAIPWKSGVVQARKHPRAALFLTVLIGVCFFCVHHFMPILHSDTLVPALQSPWFRPHIIAYMLAYTLMGAAAAIAVVGIAKSFRVQDSGFRFQDSRFRSEGQVQILVYVGLSLITIGMLFGALWAKEAWGHYWSWDPKETWAVITWFAYLVYVHYRQLPTHKPRLALLVTLISFILLQMCWWGIKFLPAAQATSVHVYGS